MQYFGLGDQPGQTRDAMMMSQLDQMIRQSIQLLWFLIPEEQRTIARVQERFNQIVARACNDLRDDTDLLKQWREGEEK